MTSTEGDRIDLRSVPALERLTAAEARVFEEYFSRRALEAGEELPLEGAVAVVRDGALSLALGPDEARRLGDVGPGGIAGEVRLFQSDPVALLARATGPTECLTISHRDLKHCFRYCRTGTVKWLVAFAKSLSIKVRDSLKLLSASDGAALSSELRPEGLGELDLDRLKAYSSHRAHAPGERLFAEGDESEELYVIDRGEVDILRDTPSGEQFLIRFGPGDFFGELSFVDGRPRSAHAVAATDLTVHVIPAGGLDEMLDHSLGFGLFLTDVICKILVHRLELTLRCVESS